MALSIKSLKFDNSSKAEYLRWLENQDKKNLEIKTPDFSKLFGDSSN